MAIEEATYFWIEAGDMQGGSRNQIEFTDEIVLFFDEKSRSAGQAFLAFNEKTKGYGAFSNRAQDYDQWVNKWRLSLITKAKGGVEYAGRVICFEKRKIGRSHVYVTSVADIGSAEHIAWKSKSKHVGSTGGADGREYGYF
ncbi:MAG: hypothetical protein ACT6XY_07075 [Phreatobacter sp.]|uniref:hypothetical protein n=1 Tax=Phreatobacter sp. TaxID=1966341 RepID=UPI00403753AF